MKRREQEVVEEVVDEVDLQEVWNVLQAIRKEFHEKREQYKEAIASHMMTDQDFWVLRGRCAQLRDDIDLLDNRISKMFPEFMGEEE